jgi:tRNA-dihydrouridine synthase B
MADPDRGEAIVRACAEALRVPVLAKLRTGWGDRGADAVEMARRCERAGAAAVAVHPRWVRQGFRGAPDWEVIRRVRASVGVAVIGSGDVRCASDAVRMREVTGCEGVMIGQAALGYPWIFREAAAALAGQPVPPPATVDDRMELAARHVSLAVADRGPKWGVREMRKHISWYLRGMPRARSLREKANRATTEAELLAILQQAREAALSAVGRPG